MYYSNRRNSYLRETLKQYLNLVRELTHQSKEKGFMESRSIINGKIIPTVGGGLCQLAGLIYYASLKANLQIL